jgi:HEAT repeat protein
MRIVLATLAVFCAVFFPAVGQAQPAEPSCAELDGAKAEKLLDYRTHGDPERARTGVVRQPGWPIYPAANALFLIGKPAEPEILKVLAKSDTSDLVRKVAIYALLNIESNEESGPVATLARASREEKDPGASQRLMDAAKEAATKCRPERQTVCINALNAK